MTASRELRSWLDDMSGIPAVWFSKRLSANDTKASGGHQAGPYLPKDVFFRVFPGLHRETDLNPETSIRFDIDSHADTRQVRAIWYNNKFHGGTRDEARLTRFGGGSSALLDPDNTGALVLFAFVAAADGQHLHCRAWVCRSAVEEEHASERFGVVDPGEWISWTTDGVWAAHGLHTPGTARADCRLTPAEIPPEWLRGFPRATEIVRRAVELRPLRHLDVDARLLRRRDCEFEIFRSLEETVELPIVQRGFPTLDQFLERAQTILQRRKARSGRSLELHVREILIEEGLREHEDFSYQPESDPGKRPDFLFPSESSYKNAAFDPRALRMLAVKTTCKDRWRQIINEADRIPRKHLLTLQEGISENQFREISGAGVTLVVPTGLVKSYPPAIRASLLPLSAFVGEVRPPSR
ncbi:MAG: type II restriction endonuclease [Deltaproteobacteria bacterium]|nr:type II restriction endonuclease [Deltaproteobacteria bacterium]